jgi:flagellar basal body-associated protein FliL
LILIVVIVVIIIALCILLAVRSTSSDYEKIGEKANQTHETIVVNEEDEEGATMGLEGDDTSLNDELG